MYSIKKIILRFAEKVVVIIIIIIRQVHIKLIKSGITHFKRYIFKQMLLFWYIYINIYINPVSCFHKNTVFNIDNNKKCFFSTKA